jgi:putative SOS response-associated peptidase YedK
MCGRYTLRTSVETLAERFELDEYPSSISASYNIAPPKGSQLS